MRGLLKHSTTRSTFYKLYWRNNATTLDSGKKN